MGGRMRGGSIASVHAVKRCGGVGVRGATPPLLHSSAMPGTLVVLGLVVAAILVLGLGSALVAAAQRGW